MDIHTIQSLLKSHIVEKQFEAIDILEQEGYLPNTIKDYLVQQYKESECHHPPKQHIMVLFKNGELKIHFNYNQYQEKGIINELANIQNLEKLSICFRNMITIPHTLYNNKCIKELIFTR